MIKDKLLRRHLRIRKKVKGTSERPRLLVKRSNKHTYAILVDDERRRVITAVSSLTKGIRERIKDMKGKVAVAKEVGKLLAEKAKELNISTVVFDRGGYKYHGRVKAVAEGAREGGLKF
jgi:large subunit ribosomal protein L18|uniref:Large ribosomal subunit protein uL18 n=1 Tax=candidate division WOR-3 bacterium TaxID=2052148 RepID=A0A7C3UYF9_UNCW3